MSSGPTEIMAAIATGLATVTNLSTARVSVCDWTIQNQPYSALVFPSLGGSQELASSSSWMQVHRIKIKLRIRDNNPQDLYVHSAVMIPLVLTWFRTNDTLGLADVITCHLEGSPLAWSSPTGDATIDDGGGVLSKEIDFVISVAVTL
jgi:hypothetical protein